MTRTSVHGHPRIGPNRELKVALERYWAGAGSFDDVEDVARDIRGRAWARMRDAGIDLIPSNDFSLYDHVLDTAAMVGAVPRRFGYEGGPVDIDTYLGMARGRPGASDDAVPMEMTKWFDTNYHHIVPELSAGTAFGLGSTKAVDEVREARSLGIATKPVLLGPLTFLLLSRPEPGGRPCDALELLEPLLAVYAEVLEGLADEEVTWVQLDEPALVQDRGARELEALRHAYAWLAARPRRPRLLLSTYFGDLGDALPSVAGLPVEGLGLDLVRGRSDVEGLRSLGGVGQRLLVAGVVDGRNVWVNDLAGTLATLETLTDLAAEVAVSTSCSLLHVPDDATRESLLDGEVRSWLAFARQKVDEVAVLAQALDGAPAALSEVEHNRTLLAERRSSRRAHDPEVRSRVQAVRAEDERRHSPYEVRREAQRRRLPLPVLPTTTIGSFPQTSELRSARAALRSGSIDEEEYRRRMRAEVERAVRLQEDLGLDVLVHGEPERSDMVQFFAERMRGFETTEHGWVQSYGTRCVRPPIIVGDVSRPEPITVEWTTYAQSLTDRPLKGMLTGPVTMLLWSFVREDQPRSVTCAQIALAVRDEVADLEAAGIGLIQVDEPAFREGLPLRRAARDTYLAWAVRCFRLATSGVADATQVHTHMCYAEFGDILPAVDALDADVISLEAARSRMEITRHLRDEGYPRQVGPGVYDVHSPRIPPRAEVAARIREATASLDAAQLWVNPDCGLKTRGYPEVEASLRAMVDAARAVRAELVGSGAARGAS